MLLAYLFIVESCFDLEINYCLRKVRISRSNLESAETDSDSLFKEKNKELLGLQEINSTEYKMSADKFLELGDNVCATVEHAITDEDILASLVSNADDDENVTVVEESNSPLT